MQFKTLVRPEHLNHNQCLFGGYMLLWVDEYSYIAAMEEFPSCRFVTRAVEAASFSQGVPDGSILTFDIERARLGNSSVTYAVNVTSMELPAGTQREVFQTHVTMCCIDENGNKKRLPR